MQTYIKQPESKRSGYWRAGWLAVAIWALAVTATILANLPRLRDMASGARSTISLGPFGLVYIHKTAGQTVTFGVHFGLLLLLASLIGLALVLRLLWNRYRRPS